MPRKTSQGSAAEFFPDKLTLPSLRAAAAGCKACDLWKLDTQTVFGEGRRRATVLFVGDNGESSLNPLLPGT
jgi:DNA polymerase